MMPCTDETHFRKSLQRTAIRTGNRIGTIKHRTIVIVQYIELDIPDTAVINEYVLARVAI